MIRPLRPDTGATTSMGPAADADVVNALREWTRDRASSANARDGVQAPEAQGGNSGNWEPTPAGLRPRCVRRGGSRAGSAVSGAVVVVAGALLAGCAAQAPTGEQPGAKRPTDPVELIGQGLVLENGSHGPQLCLGAIATSLPPQCGGPDIANWDWAKVSGESSVAGTTEGSYIVIGHFDRVANVFTLTR